MSDAPLNKPQKLFLILGFFVLAALASVWLYAVLVHTQNHRDVQSITIAQAGDFFLYAPLYVAQETGAFERHGLRVQITNTGGDEKTWAALLSGDAQFGVADPTFVAVSAARGQPGRVVASIVNGVPFWGITMRDNIQEIKSPQELNGYSVATFPSPSTAYTLQARMFREAGLEPNIRQGAFGTLLPILRAKQADIALELEPNVSQAVRQGARVLYSLNSQYGDFAMTGLTTTPQFISTNSEVVQDVVCSINDALRYIREDRQGTLRILRARFPEINQSVAALALERVQASGIIPKSPVISEGAWKAAIDLRIECGDLQPSLSAAGLVDNSFAERAEQGICKVGSTRPAQ